jgi:hypothetical protein
MSAPAAWANAQKKAQSGHRTGVKSVKWMNQENIISSGELFQSTLAFAGVIQSFPKQEKNSFGLNLDLNNTFENRETKR